MACTVNVFIDVGNQFYCINKKWEGRKLNYKAYLDKAATFGTVGRAFAYGTKIDEASAKFITALHHLGFEPHFKQVEKNTWFSWDVGLAVDVIRLAEKQDVIVIGNSSRNIVPVISWAKERGIRVVVMACGISRELKEVCDQWIEITEDMLEVQTVDEDPTDESSEAA